MNTYVAHETLEDHKFSLQSVHFLIKIILDLCCLLGALKRMSQRRKQDQEVYICMIKHLLSLEAICILGY